MSMNRLLTFLFSAVIGNLNSNAQSPGVTNPQMNAVTITSPNSASLGKFGEYPVTLYNGLVDISIPIFDIKSTFLSLPISLKYHPSGIRVADVASWAGLGWTLDAGGLVSRSVVGRIDEGLDGYLASGNLIKGSLNFQTSQNDLNYLLNLQHGYIDGEPDVFAYNFPGKSGHFIFNTDKTSLLKIPLDKTQITQNISSNQFNITDENGVSYQFGKGLDGSTAYEANQSYNPSSQTSVYTVTSWLLTAIISADKSDTILFKYWSKALTGPTDLMDYCVINDSHNMGGSSGTQALFSNYGNCTTSTVYSSVSEFKLQEIDFRNGKVTFDTAADFRLDRSGDKRLNKITIYQLDNLSNTYKQLKAVQFFQSYYSNNDRLRLDSIEVLDNQNLSNQTYKFVYNPTLLPSYLSRQRDWWGYFNSNPGQTLVEHTLIDYVTDAGINQQNVYIGDADRSPDTTKMQACVLQKIYYPTGGRTEFTYESNKYLYTGGITIAGGLRIKQIKNYDSLTPNPTILTYRYGNNECGYGALNVATNFLGINPSFYSSSITSQSWVQGCPEIVRARTYSSSLNIGLVPFDGNPVYYDSVTEYKGDPSTGQTQGKTIYYYQFNGDINNFFVLNSNKIFKQSYYWKRGFLGSKVVYDNLGNIVYRLDNSYVVNQTQTFDSVGFLENRNFDYVAPPQNSETLLDPNVSGGSCSHGILLFNYVSYNLQTGNYLLSNSVETSVDQNNPTKYLTKTTSYTYDNTNYLPATITSDYSTGEQEVTYIKYPLDYTIGSSPDSKSLGIKNLQNSNIITPAVEKYVNRMNGDGSNSRTTAAVLNSFKPSKPYLDTLYRIENTAGLTNFSPSGTSGNNFTKDSRYVPAVVIQNYDSKGNTSQQCKINDVNNTYIWDYNKTYPVAVVLNADSLSVAYTSFEADGSGNWTIPSTSRDNANSITGGICYNLSNGSISRAALASSVTYFVSYWSKTGSSFTVTGSTGVTQGKTINGWTFFKHTVTNTSTVSVSGAGEIDELRLYPSTAQMTSYTYSPLVGMTSSCDMNNRITYYIYDKLSRLQLIKDQDGNIIKTIQYNYIN